MTEVGLRPFARRDFDSLAGWIRTAEELMLWSGPTFRFPLSWDQFGAHLMAAQGPHPLRRVYTAEDPASSVMLGHIELNNIDTYHRAATLCRVLIDPGRRGEGLGREMVAEALRIGFDELRLHRIDLLVFDFNAPAIACYERLGFVREGRLRDFRRFGDTFWSVYQMSLLESEWPTERRASHPEGERKAR